MRVFLHFLAAFAGIVLAAVIVVLVFEQASQQGARQEGNAPKAVQLVGSGGADCTQVHPGDYASADAIARAAKSPPAIVDATKGSQQEVQVVDRAQADWIARVQAAFGLCLDELAVDKASVNAVATLPAGTSEADVDAYTYHFLQRAFEPGLARPTVTLDLSIGGNDKRKLLVREFAWAAFQRSHGAYRLPASVAGLRLFRRKVGYTQREMRFDGW